MNFLQGRHGSTTRWLTAVTVCALVAGCAVTQPETQPEAEPEAEPVVKAAPEVAEAESEAARRADEERIRALEREVERLKMDLVRAEDTLVAVESRLESGHSRANAVSSLAEAQMQLNKTSDAAPWRPQEIDRARGKLDIAQKHIDDEYFGAAMFFIYRANRIIEQLNYEFGIVEASPQAMFVNRPRINLRSRPSIEDEILAVLTEGTPVIREERQGSWILVHTLNGLVGWVHQSLVTGKSR